MTKRFYNTGDIGKISHEGYLTYLGRQDDPVKIRGYRIELDEVTHIIKKHPLIKDVEIIPLVQDGSNLDQILVGFVVPSDDLSDHKMLLEQLKQYVRCYSFGIGIPNILSKALMCYQDNVGAASSIFGLLYYCWVSRFVFGIGSFLPNSLFIMPLYFLIISLLMVICIKYIILE